MLDENDSRFNNFFFFNFRFIVIKLNLRVLLSHRSKTNYVSMFCSSGVLSKYYSSSNSYVSLQ